MPDAPHPPSFDPEAWKHRLRAVGLRITSARLDVLRTLHSFPRPATAQDILDAVERLGHTDRVTVYRTLNSLVEAGIAHRVDPGDRTWRFGLVAGEHASHAHFVCDDCGTIRCLADATVTVSMKGRPGGGRFRVKQQDVYLHGTCETCLIEPRTTAPKKRKSRPRL